MVKDMRRKKSSGLFSTMMILGTATAAAAVAYKLKQGAKENVSSNFEEYMGSATKCSCKGDKKFNIKDIMSKVKQNIKNEGLKQDEGFDDKSYQTTMLYRKNRVYNKPLKGIRREKGI